MANPAIETSTSGGSWEIVWIHQWGAVIDNNRPIEPGLWRQRRKGWVVFEYKQGSDTKWSLYSLFQSWLAINKPFSLVPAFCEHLTFSLSRELRVFSINNPSVPTHFPYRDPYSLTEPTVRLPLFVAVWLVLCSCSFSFCFKRRFISLWSWQYVHRLLCLYWIASQSSTLIFSWIICFTFVDDDFNFRLQFRPL